MAGMGRRLRQLHHQDIPTTTCTSSQRGATITKSGKFRSLCRKTQTFNSHECFGSYFQIPSHASQLNADVDTHEVWTTLEAECAKKTWDVIGCSSSVWGRKTGLGYVNAQKKAGGHGSETAHWESHTSSISAENVGNLL